MSSLSRALSILESFSNERPEQTFSSIVSSTGLPAATAHRYLAELVAWGGLDRTSRGSYRVGMRLWQLGALAPGERQLRDVALPFLEDLLEATHTVVHLVVLDGTRALYVEKLSPHVGRADLAGVASQVGYRLPLHATAPGKVLLALGPTTVLDAVLSDRLEKTARNTITDAHALRANLAGIRDAGYSISREETTDGHFSVAAPIFGPAEKLVAAISVVVPADTQHLLGLAHAVRVAAVGISRNLQ